MLQLTLRYDFYNITFKIERKFYVASGSVSPRPSEWKDLGANLPQTARLWSGKVTAFLEWTWRRKANFDIYYFFIIILYWRQTLVGRDRFTAEGCCLYYCNKSVPLTRKLQWRDKWLMTGNIKTTACLPIRRRRLCCSVGLCSSRDPWFHRNGSVITIAPPYTAYKFSSERVS